MNDVFGKSDFSVMRTEDLIPMITIGRLKRENEELKDEIKALKRQLAYYKPKKLEAPEALLKYQEKTKKSKEQKTAARNALMRLLATSSPMTRKEVRAWNDNTHKLALNELASVIGFLERRKMVIKDRYKNYWHFSCR